MQTDTTPDSDVVATTRQLLTLLFGGQRPAARKLHFDERSVRYWCKRGAPPHILGILWRLRREEISLPWARTLMHRQRTRRVNGRASS